MPTGPRVMPGRYRCRSVSWDRYGQPGPCATLIPAAEPRSGVAQSAERPAVNRQVASSSLAPRADEGPAVPRAPRIPQSGSGVLCLGQPSGEEAPLRLGLREVERPAVSVPGLAVAPGAAQEP